MGLTQQSFRHQLFTLLPEECSENISFCVGFSGGLDSTVLLHLLSKLQLAQSSKVNPFFSIKAIHINHQLQDEAESWSQFCQHFCYEHKIPFKTIKVALKGIKKMGIEAAARNVRYRTFAEHTTADDILLTAHHRDDQVETVFLQLLRGTGLDGAAAINAKSIYNQRHLLRPLLSFDRKQILEYAHHHQLQWIEDPSNVKTDFRRNYLRHEILPIIEKRWPAYRQTVERFSNNARSASTALNDYIANDYKNCLNAKKHSLLVDELIKLALEKRLMVIRFWIKQAGYRMPDESVLLQIHNVLFAIEDSNPLVEWGNASIRRYRKEIYLLPRTKNKPNRKIIDWNLNSPVTIDGVGVISCEKIMGEGINSECINLDVKIGFRKGGEKCRPLGRAGSHSLKKLFQEYAVPPWQRENIPIIWVGNEIAIVVGLFYCEKFSAKKDQLGVLVKLNDESFWV